MLGALCAALASCQNDSVPTAPRTLNPARATTITENYRVPFEIPVFVSCANGGTGEDVLISGSLHVILHRMINTNRFVLKTQSQAQGMRGVGQITGDKYQGTFAAHETINGSFVNGQFKDTFVFNFRVLGQGPSNNFIMQIFTHMTINANGEVATRIDRFKVLCK